MKQCSDCLAEGFAGLAQFIAATNGPHAESTPSDGHSVACGQRFARDPPRKRMFHVQFSKALHIHTGLIFPRTAIHPDSCGDVLSSRQLPYHLNRKQYPLIRLHLHPLRHNMITRTHLTPHAGFPVLNVPLQAPRRDPSRPVQRDDAHVARQIALRNAPSRMNYVTPLLQYERDALFGHEPQARGGAFERLAQYLMEQA